MTNEDIVYSDEYICVACDGSSAHKISKNTSAEISVYTTEHVLGVEEGGGGGGRGRNRSEL